MLNIKKGFTLIELLVVIAIIGLLTSIALASLKTARNKAIDATIKQNLAQIRAQAQIVYDNSGSAASYVGTFTEAAPGLPMYNASVAAGNNGGGWYEDPGNPEIGPSSWIAWVGLKSESTNAWCTDYTGVSTKIGKPSGGTLFIAPYACPSTPPN